MELLRTWTATTLVPVDAGRAWTELAGLVLATWPTDTDIVESVAGRRLVHAVLVDGEPDVWLTWVLEGLPCGATRVAVQLDEIAGAAPEPELDALLVTLLSRCAPTLAG